MSKLKKLFCIKIISFFILQLFSKEPYSFNININCSNQNTNTNNNKNEIEQKTPEAPQSDGGLIFWLYNNAKTFLIIITLLYFSQYVNFKKIKNIIHYIKYIIFKKKNNFNDQKKIFICQLCRKKNSFFTFYL